MEPARTWRSRTICCRDWVRFEMMARLRLFLPWRFAAPRLESAEWWWSWPIRRRIRLLGFAGEPGFGLVPAAQLRLQRKNAGLSKNVVGQIFPLTLSR